MTSLYEILKASKTGIASDLLTALRGRQYAASLIQERELEGVPPLLFKANGEPLIDWSIYGNTVQSGTPSPQNPVMPNGCGERTGNLCFKIIRNSNISTTGEINTLSGYDLAIAEVKQGEKYSGIGYIYAFFESEPTNGSVSYNQQRTVNSLLNVTSPIDGYVALRVESGTNSMINIGSTPLPYEPYGYKLDIKSANTTTPVYLGEVQTTRQIEKIKLDELSWTYISTASYSGFYIYDYTTDLVEAAGGYCNKLVVHTGTFTSAPNNSITIFESSGRQRLFIRYDDAQGDTTALMGMLNGSVFYGVKTTPTTGILNEPLRKIGDYADSLTATQAGVEIPTIKGNNTLDIDTTVKPSKVYIKYKG